MNPNHTRFYRITPIRLATLLLLASCGSEAQTLQAQTLQEASPTQLASAELSNTEPMQTVVVETSRISQVGMANSANAGVVTQKQLAARAVYRPAELLETTPGLVVSQHSGEGKANQFYLRGFNLDHGTDLRIQVDGMLVNQRSHSHGQGWSDLNFLIPELTSRLDYHKGGFEASDGDFSAAGAVNISYLNTLEQGLASIGIGEFGYMRTFIANSPAVGKGHLLYALELFHNDGPFEQGDNFRKINGVLRYSQGTAANGFNITAMGYHGSDHATDQIPLRALGTPFLKSRFDAIDQTDGGSAYRYSLSGEYRDNGNLINGVKTRVNAYVIQTGLDLFSNFTYFLNDPIRGDQFSQPDRRVTTALETSFQKADTLFGMSTENTVGLQFQNDNIRNGLNLTQARRTLSTVRADHIVETSLGLYFQNRLELHPKVRAITGVREDIFRSDIKSDNALNSGSGTDHIGSGKLNLIFGPWAKTEFYVNVGTGFHSNDARGTTTRVDPASGEATIPVTPLVRARSQELGVRSEFVPGLNSTFSIYRLDFESELLFVGDAGTTEPGRPSRRTGFEFSNYYKPLPWLTVDADVAFAKARYRDPNPAGNRITGAVEGVASLALAVDQLGPWFGALQLRYFGPRPLLEDNTVRSKSTTTLNGRLGYKFSPKLELAFEGFNLTNRQDSAIDYFYTSRLPGEPAQGVDDVHFHPIEKRSFRVQLNVKF